MVSIQVPSFRGLEPKLVLAYSSEARNGFAGVGWSLSGWSVVERAKPGRGTPRYDGNDIYLLDGAELVPCPAGTASPGCVAGGTHTTKNESYLKIRFDGATNSWTVWGRDGTRTVLTPVYVVGAQTFRWGQTSVIDTQGNTVSYAWAMEGADCYPDAISYGPYAVKFYREARSDKTSFAIGSAGGLGLTEYRLRSIRVARGAATIRAYKLTYEQSTLSGRSLLKEVAQYGQDAAIDAAGVISGGTALPPRIFSYQSEPAGKTFSTWPAGAY